MLRIAFADLWRLHPLGYIGSMGIGVPMPSALADAEIRVYVGTTLQNALGLVALWAPIVLGTAMGVLARHRSDAKTGILRDGP